MICIFNNNCFCCGKNDIVYDQNSAFDYDKRLKNKIIFISLSSYQGYSMEGIPWYTQCIFVIIFKAPYAFYFSNLALAYILSMNVRDVNVYTLHMPYTLPYSFFMTKTLVQTPKLIIKIIRFQSLFPINSEKK